MPVGRSNEKLADVAQPNHGDKGCNDQLEWAKASPVEQQDGHRHYTCDYQAAEQGHVK